MNLEQRPHTQIYIYIYIFIYLYSVGQVGLFWQIFPYTSTNSMYMPYCLHTYPQSNMACRTIPHLVRSFSHWNLQERVDVPFISRQFSHQCFHQFFRSIFLYVSDFQSIFRYFPSIFSIFSHGSRKKNRHFWGESFHDCQAIDGELGGLEERTLILQFTEAPRQRIQAQVNNERHPDLVVVASGVGGRRSTLW